MIGVTGGTGFVGQRLVAHLAKETSVRVLSTGIAAHLVPGVEYVRGDIRSSELANQFAAGCSVIIHLAGVAHTCIRTKEDLDRLHSINVHGTRTISEAALLQGVHRFVLVSSAHVYAAQAGLDIKEDSPVAAASAYAESKIDAERVLRKVALQGMKVVIARPCLTYGPAAQFNLARLLKAIDAGYYFHIAGANPLRSMLSVENAVRALQYLSTDPVSEGTYNLADARPVPLVDFVNELADRMGRKRPGTFPAFAVKLARVITETVEKLGSHLPVSGDTFAKLTSDFSIDTGRLAATGFTWDSHEGQIRQQMVDVYLRSRRG